MSHRLQSGAENAAGIFGVLLIFMVGKLDHVAYRAQGPPRTARRFLARRAIDVIFAIGWLVDRFAGYPFDVSTPNAIATKRAVITQD